MQGITSAINQNIHHQAKESSGLGLQRLVRNATPQPPQAPAISADTVSLSPQGQSLQKLDTLFQQVDSVYESHMTKNDLIKTEEIYLKLELMGEQLNDKAFTKQTEPLFKELDIIFSAVESRFSVQDTQQLDRLNQQIDQRQEGQFEQMDQLQQAQDKLLLSKLGAKDRQQISKLNQQLETLYSNNHPSEQDQQTINKLFESLDARLNKGYQQLNSNEKAQVDGLNKQINQIELQIEEFEEY